MAFKAIPGELKSPDDPEALFRDLRGRTIQGLLSQQADVLREYTRVGVDLEDVAIQLPTGSGKTLVGLLIAEWRRRKFRERVLYLCPTRQLVNQVVANATSKYGLRMHGLVGRKREFDPAMASEYMSSEAVAVTTYSALFNSHPFFEDPQVIIVDDAHAAESYIASMWSLRVLRRTHETMFLAVLAVLKDVLSATDYQRVRSDNPDHWDERWIEMVPAPKFDLVAATLEGLLDAHCTEEEHRFTWGCLKGHLPACNLFLTPHEILIRPLVPPTFEHAPFAAASRRIYMSATLGAGGDLERITGRKSIRRISPPAGFERQGVGRRFFLFPGRSLEAAGTKKVIRELIDDSPRTLYLVPSEARAQEARESLESLEGMTFFNASDLEHSKERFVTSCRAVALVANRYDGIDLSGDECRLLIFDGFPSTTNLQENFLVTRMAAGVILDERLGTRLAQGFGRCTRSDTDYAVVVVAGDSISGHLLRAERRAHFHPELQAELEFGLEQSKDLPRGEFLENFREFLEQGDAWQAAEGQLLSIRDARTRNPRAGEADLAKAVAHEVDFAQRLWNGDLLGAIAAAESVLSVLNDEHLRGYRALWNYLAGCCAWRLSQDDGDGLRARARECFRRAAAGATSVYWLHELARAVGEVRAEAEVVQQALLDQVCGLEVQFDRLGMVHNRNFEEALRQVSDGLAGATSPLFEHAHTLLGTMLGFEAGAEGGPAEPDSWWRTGTQGFIAFEDHADALATSSIAVAKVRQASSHRAWVLDKLSLPPTTQVATVIVSPCQDVDRAARPLGKEVHFLALHEFLDWAKRAMECIRELRATYPGRPDFAWRADAAERLKAVELDGPSIMSMATRRTVADLRVRG